jgi:hypothetical protein
MFCDDATFVDRFLTFLWALGLFGVGGFLFHERREQVSQLSEDGG